MNVHIRKAETGDINILSSFLSKLFTVEDDFKINDKAQRHGLKLLIDDAERSAVYVAVAEDGLAGMVTGQIVVSTAAGGYSVLLEDMFVDLSMRGRGIGGLLLDEIVMWGIKKGAARVQLVADMRNTRAIEFYQRNRFVRSNMIGIYNHLQDIDR